MAQLDQLKRHLKSGKVYRRNDLQRWSRSVDRHLEALVEEGALEKLSTGLYYAPKQSVFGKTPPDEKELVRTFLKDDRFLLTSPNAYNALGVGTTQLYNQRTVYNHKRHGTFKLGNRIFHFRIKPHFPSKITEEFLLVDLVNSLDTLAENRSEILRNIAAKISEMDTKKVLGAINAYGNVRTKKYFRSLLPVT